jgi:hypothetical protein
MTFTLATRPVAVRKMFLTIVDAILGAIVLKFSYENLDPGTFRLGLLIVGIAVIWHFIK